LDITALIDGIKQGDRVAFRQLVEQYQALVYNTVLAIVRQPDEADKVSQGVPVYRLLWGRAKPDRLD